MLDALTRLVLRESQVQPLLLIVEDVHWVDAETQAWLDSLVERLPTARFMLLVNYRPEVQHGWGRKTYYTQVPLDPLPPTSADELLHALLGDDTNSRHLSRALLDCTHGGQPLLSEESVRSLVEAGVLLASQAPIAWPSAADLECATTVQAVRRRASTARRRRKNGSCRRLRRLAPRCPYHCCRPLPSYPRRRCMTACAPPGGRVPVRDAAVPRPGLHLQACPHARGGLQQSAPGAAAAAAYTPCRDSRSAHSRPGGRADRTPGVPCSAG